MPKKKKTKTSSAFELETRTEMRMRHGRLRETKVTTVRRASGVASEVTPSAEEAEPSKE